MGLEEDLLKKSQLYRKAKMLTKIELKPSNDSAIKIYENKIEIYYPKDAPDIVKIGLIIYELTYYFIRKLKLGGGHIAHVEYSHIFLDENEKRLIGNALLWYFDGKRIKNRIEWPSWEEHYFS